MMTKSKLIIISILIISLLVWGIDLYLKDMVFSGRIIIKESMYITGIVSFLYMGLIMFLSIRPKCLEYFLGGMDKIYYLHKWAGIWAIIFAAIHYLIDLSKPILSLLITQGAKIKKNQVDLSGIQILLSDLRGVAKSTGEYAIYFLLIMLVLTLWKKFPYKFWRYLHKLMAPIFLMIAFHTIILSPIKYWFEPVGVLLLMGIVIGSTCVFISIFGLIGKKSTHKGKVVNIKKYEDLIEVDCQLSGNWSHQAGQYAFFKHNHLEGSHPFTISSVDYGNNQIKFSIKQLGDYTNQLKNLISVGDVIEVEGPYGLFNYSYSQSEHQIWIGAGIGITPFIAWIERMVKDNDREINVDFYYCVPNVNKATYLNYLNEICASLPNVNFHPYYNEIEGLLTINQLPLKDHHTRNTFDIWFCGPNQFAKRLKKEIKIQGLSHDVKFHQEIFQMR